MAEEIKSPAWVKKIKDCCKKEGKTLKKRSHKSEYVFSIIANLILLYVFNNLLNWNIPYLTSQWTAPLWVLNLSIIITIAINAIFLLFDRNPLKAALKIVANFVSILFLLTLYQVFPFDFGTLSFASTADLVMRILIILAIVGTVIGMIVEFFKLFSTDSN